MAVRHSGLKKSEESDTEGDMSRLVPRSYKLRVLHWYRAISTLPEICIRPAGCSARSAEEILKNSASFPCVTDRKIFMLRIVS